MTIFTSINGNKIYISQSAIVAIFPTVHNGAHCTCIDTDKLSYIVKEKFEDVVAHLYPLAEPVKQLIVVKPKPLPPRR
jgi:hypothetical protein